jgi:hypothetical protein
MSEREKARKLFVEQFRERVRPEMVFDLICHLNNALGQFKKPFNSVELALACQHLVFHHQQDALIAEIIGERKHEREHGVAG